MALPEAPPPKHNLVRIIAIVLLALIVLVGLAILITWLVIKPKGLVYTIEDGSIQSYTLANNHLSASFEFHIRAYNPNHRVSIYYDWMHVSVAYGNQTLAFNTIEPFFQPHRNVTWLDTILKSHYLALSKFTAKGLSVEKSSGKVAFDVYLNARIRFKVGIWKSKHRTLKVECYPVIVDFSSAKRFESTYCDVDL